MTSSRTPLIAVLLALAFGAAASPAAAQVEVGGAEVVQDREALADPVATVVGTPTPTPTPVSSPGQEPESAAEAWKPTSADYSAPGYGSAALQPPRQKSKERSADCSAAKRPPTSHMLGVPGVVPGGSGGAWVPLAIAIAAGAALFAAVAFGLRRGGSAGARPGPLESIATLVAICGGIAALAAQFVPGVGVAKRSPPDAQVLVRDVKPRITFSEYARRMQVPLAERSKEDRSEVGNVVWLQIALKGFKDRDLALQYGVYDIDAGEVLLPGTDRRLELKTPRHDVQTTFLPVWIGYPERGRFKAEFRLLDRNGVQQFASTPPMKTSRFRYACGTEG